MFGKKTSDGYTEVIPGIKIKTISYGKNTLMTEFKLKKDSQLTEHTHEHEQTGYLVSGRIRLFIGDDSKELNPGDSWNIASNIKHKAEIIEDSVAIEVFSPCREDYLKFLNTVDICK